jgi:hypothetical protein
LCWCFSIAFSSYDETNGLNDDSSDAGGGDDNNNNNNNDHSNMIVARKSNGRIREMLYPSPYPAPSLILDTTHCPAQ